jgi:hypothetical protein
MSLKSESGALGSRFNPQPSSLQYAAAEGEGPKALWLVCAPCVGSTWLSRMMTELLKWHTVWPAPRNVWRRPQDVKYTKKIDAILGNIYLQHTHTMFNANTRTFLLELKPKVVVLHRDIFDNVVSTVDHLQKLDTGLPNGWVSDEFKKLSFEDAAWHVIHFFLPWNLNFYCSWAYAQQAGFAVHYVDYHDLHANTMAALGRVLAVAHVSRSADELTRAIEFGADATATRYNVGMEGRGHRLLTQDMKDHIMTMIRRFKDPVGRAALDRIMPSQYDHSKSDPAQPDNSRRSAAMSEDVPSHDGHPNSHNEIRPTGRLPAHDTGAQGRTKGARRK